ncbi:class I SAM-dependent methyltransferase [Patescibacteria group bacterium]|nr:class I SAM-dependent methyltransferase [Patescibacteria group bacterium]
MESILYRPNQISSSEAALSIEGSSTVVTLPKGMEKRRRDWALPDQWDFDPTRHFVFIENVFANGPTVDRDYSPYEWDEKVEDHRLLMQNNCPPVSWGDGHSHMLSILHERGFSPRKIVQIGTGQEASLTANLSRAFPEAQIMVIDLSSKKIQGAKETLRVEGYDMQRIDLITGDAAVILPTLKEVDLIENQNLLMHLPERGENGRNIPPIWDEERMGPFPTLDRLIGVITQSLGHGGITMIGDLAVRQWNTYPAEGYGNNPDVQAKAARAQQYIANAIRTSWDARGANAWRGPAEIASKVVQFSEGQLLLETGLSGEMGFDNLDPTHPMTSVTAYIPPTMALAVTNTRINYEKAVFNVSGSTRDVIIARIARLRDAEQMLWDGGALYSQLLQDPRFRTTLPTLSWQFFRKI